MLYWATLFLILSFISSVSSYKFSKCSSFGSLFKKAESKTNLFAHHPEKKIIKKMMDGRPKKHRLSDINRKNSNLDKSIYSIENSPADYTIISAADFEIVKASAYDFWKNGSPDAKWVEITAEDSVIALPQFNEGTQKYIAPKRTGLIKSGTRFLKQ